MIHMSQACCVYYPTGVLVAADEAGGLKSRAEASHFGGINGTGATYSLVVEDGENVLDVGDEVGVFVGEMCVGSAEWTGEPVLGVAVWGDDASTSEIDGCVEGDELTFRVWDASEATESTAEVQFLLGDGAYGTGPFGHLVVLDPNGSPEDGNELNPVNRLLQNQPNPFSGETGIRYELSRPGRVNLGVFSARGERVRTLVDGHEDAGIHNVTWDGRNEAGQKVGPGIYLYRLEAGDFQAMRKMLLVK